MCNRGRKPYQHTRRCHVGKRPSVRRRVSEAILVLISHIRTLGIIKIDSFPKLVSIENFTTVLATSKMIGSRKGPGGSSIDPNKRAKAHINCPNGINDTLFLAACLDAMKVDNVDKSLEMLHSSIFCARDNRSVPVRTTAVKPAESKYLCIGTKSEKLSTAIILKTLYTEVVNNTGETIVLWEDLPRWVVGTSKRVFSEVFKVLESHEQEKFGDGENMNVSDRNSLSNDETVYSSIFNVIATLMCLHSMGVREVSCSPLPVIHCASESSSNAEALADLQRGMTIDPSTTFHFDEETSMASVLSTANGMSLLRILTGVDTSCRSRITPMVLKRRGYGVDNKDTNLKISVLVGSTEGGECVSESGSSSSGVGRSNSKMGENSLFHSDHVAHLETNLDDISGESLAFAIELLLQHGAIDAWVTPIIMKKGRPAHTLHCLCKDNNSSHFGGNDNDDGKIENTTLDRLLELIFEHTSTLGVRIYRGVPRAKLDRSMVTVTTPFTNTSRKGRVDIKVSRFKNGRIVRKKAEFDHCKEIAIETGVGIRVVADEAIKAHENKHSNK